MTGNTESRTILARWHDCDDLPACTHPEPEDDPCSRCGGPLDDSGEGYMDLCPSCADATEEDD